jgi:8-oxo-dGTP pyrophosphatase MutT (NUDIX family)
MVSLWDILVEENEYFGNKAAGSIVYAKKEKEFLIVKRQSKVIDGWKKVKEPGAWSLVISGKQDDKDRNSKITAIREFKEELKYNGKFIISNKPIDYFVDGDFRFSTYVIIVDKKFKPILNWEHEDYKWIKDINKDIKSPIHFGTERLNKKKILKYIKKEI